MSYITAILLHGEIKLLSIIKMSLFFSKQTQKISVILKASSCCVLANTIIQIFTIAEIVSF